MANKVQFGLSNVHIAFLTNEAAGTFDTPEALPGAVKLSLTPEGDESPFYADNVEYFTSRSNQGYKGDLEVALLPDAMKAEMLGWLTDEDGAIVEVADATSKPFALMCEIDGDANVKRRIFYKVTAGRPQADSSTKSKTIEPSTDVLPVTITPMSLDGELVVQRSIERSVANATVYDAWYTSVQKPTFPVA